MADNLETVNRIKELKDQHRKLDAEIEQLAGETDFDQIKLQRLKKEKLALKDQISKIEAGEVPDIIA
ncbi:MAG: YdcH family protein [Rhodospirillaceae bacterium]|jgi:hypothetical protein|nr:YdcH family protein [Rhodospirillaceae bacterium]MBT5940672.1 YdcH family protein [Rhodospirillaceae bacterium]MBT7955951.1 YdcH family protein [Rhodospirillaceae bacterium]